MLLNAMVVMVVVSAPKGSLKVDAGVLGEQLPLALLVRTPEELHYKALAERQYLLVTLLISAKAAWDKNDFSSAATQWEAALRVPEVPAELEAAVRTFAKVARERAGGQSSAPLPVAQPEVVMVVNTSEAEPVKPTVLPVSGVITGGGANGPGGAVVVLRPVNRAPPKPKPTRVRAVVQRDKRFVPHVLAVPLGATVEFRNEDEFFHNVFSITKPNDFDLGLYKPGEPREQVFSTPGPVHLLCNIHSQMNGWLYVSDSPWFAQADKDGRFTIKNVPLGQWEVEVWHEWATQTSKRTIVVSGAPLDLSIAVDGDRRAPAFSPDKSGKPRQPQLGY